MCESRSVVALNNRKTRRMNKKIQHILLNIMNKMHIAISRNALLSMWQFIKFCLVGLSNTLISYIINIVVLVILTPLKIECDYFIGNIISYLLSVLWSFYWNNRFVFVQEKDKTRSVGKALVKTYIAYGFTGIILNNIMSLIWIDKLGISKYIAPFINLIISVPLNFFINKLWAFRTEDR